MKKYIENSVVNFFHETLSVRCEKYTKFPPLQVYTAKIELGDGTKTHSFSLCMKEETVQLISEALLFEDNPDQEVKMDLVCECANLIIGSAKVAIEEDHEGGLLQLTPPEYQGYFEEEFSKVFDEKYYFLVKGEPIMIGMEEVKVPEAV